MRFFDAVEDLADLVCSRASCAEKIEAIDDTLASVDLAISCAIMKRFPDFSEERLMVLIDTIDEVLRDELTA